MQKIIIKSVEEKYSRDGSKTFYVVTDSKGGTFSTFNTDVLSLKADDVIEGEVEVSGKYANLKDYKVISTPKAEDPKTEQVLQKSDKQPAYFADTRNSIEGQVAAKIGSDLLCAKIIAGDSPLGKATISWCEKRLNAVIPSNPDVEKAKKDIKDLWPEDNAKTTPATPQATKKASEVPVDQQIPAKNKIVLDLEWVKKTLEETGWADAGKWLTEHFKVKGTRVSELVAQLTPAQQREFESVLNDRAAGG